MKKPVTVSDLLGGLVDFLTQQLGRPIASPAVFEKIGTRFRAEV